MATPVVWPSGSFYVTCNYLHGKTGAGFSERIEVSQQNPEGAIAYANTYRALRLAICHPDIRMVAQTVRHHAQRGASWQVPLGTNEVGVLYGTDQSYWPEVGLGVRFNTSQGRRSHRILRGLAEPQITNGLNNIPFDDPNLTSLLQWIQSSTLVYHKVVNTMVSDTITSYTILRISSRKCGRPFSPFRGRSRSCKLRLAKWLAANYTQKSATPADTTGTTQ